MYNIANAALLVSQIRACNLISEELREIRESEGTKQGSESVNQKIKKKKKK